MGRPTIAEATCPACGRDRASRITVSQRRLLIALLGDEPKTLVDLAAEIHMTTENTRVILLWWKEQGVIRIVGWQRKNATGPFVALYLAQPGEDAPRPSKLTTAEICQRWRSRQPKAKVLVNSAPRIGVWGL